MSDLSQCKCGARIIFMKTKGGKTMPVDFKVELATETDFDPKKMVSHFATCPNAAQFRKPKK